MAKEPEFDVLIVGLGPVGATLANFLGISGVKTLVLEREAEAYHLPRAVHFDDEVMRVFQAIGLGENVEAIARVNLGMKFVDSTGNLLLDWPRPPGLSDMGWNSSYRFHQPDLEDVLRSGLQRFRDVHVKCRHEVIEISEHGDGVTVLFRNRDSGETFQSTARYVVGCDGARSFVREAMGVQMEDLGFQEKWLVVDLILRREKPSLGDHTIQYCNPERPSTYVRGPGLRRRWEIAVKDQVDPTEVVSDEYVWGVLSEWLSKDEAVLERKAVYQFSSSIAENWRVGRMMVAGDAAHLMPPFMGQGMCAGIRDVSNLSWKLTRCIHAQRSNCNCDEILDTYGLERRPHVREYIDTAVKLGGLINASGTLDQLEAAFRQEDGSVRMKSIAPKLGDSSLLHTNNLSGIICRQPLLKDGVWLDDKTGTTAWVLLHRLCGVAVSRCLDLGPDDLMLFDGEEEPNVGSLLEGLKAEAVLVRPDRHIYGAADTLENLELMLQKAKASI